jgi:hypothetical protein
LLDEGLPPDLRIRWRGVFGGWFVFSLKECEKENHAGMEIPHVFPLGEGLELTQMEKEEDQCVLHVTATSPSALCPLCKIRVKDGSVSLYVNSSRTKEHALSE